MGGRHLYFWQSQILGSYFLELRGECHWQNNLKAQVTEILMLFLFYESEKQTNRKGLGIKTKKLTPRWLPCQINKEEPTE